MYIASQESFNEFIGRVSQSPLLAIDTEFLREKTYYPRLCLVQLATTDDVAVVDPFAVKDLSALGSMLDDERCVKIFHAGEQDISILWRETGVLARPVFDTQLAAALLGHVQQIGYGALVHSLCGVTLKKLDSFTDWSRRPLSESQLRYAAEDVSFLPAMYEKMVDMLKAKGRLSWLDEDFAALSDPSRYTVDPKERFRRLKRASSLSRHQLAAAQALAAWREEEAMRRDIPRKWVLTDEQVVEACKREATTIDELFMVRGMRERLSTRDARIVASLMAEALAKPESQWPEYDRSSRSERNVDASLDLMNALLRLRAKENDIAMQTLATHDDLTLLARGHDDDVEVLKGWRRSLIGNELKELLAGSLSLSLEDGELRVHRISL